MNPVYLDNASTTQPEKEVVDYIKNILDNYWGNPSSIHQLGREARVLIEEGRKKIAGLLNINPGEIIYTSGGTEAINIALLASIQYCNIKNIISSKLEHPATLNSINFIQDFYKINCNYVRINNKGEIDLSSLEELLSRHTDALVCLMHANNEIGNLLSIKETSELCKKYNAYFLCDMVQTMGKYNIDLKSLNPSFAICSAHKFHGLKGSGFLYVNKNLDIKSIIHGGGQERNIRSGTENIYGIIGLNKALEISIRDLDYNFKHISTLKAYLIKGLKENFNDVEFNGTCETGGLYNIVNVSFPLNYKSSMIIQKMDIAGIYTSSGSACHSSSNEISHVLKNIGSDINRVSIRLSLSKFNQQQDIDKCLEFLKKELI